MVYLIQEKVYTSLIIILYASSISFIFRLKIINLAYKVEVKFDYPKTCKMHKNNFFYSKDIFLTFKIMCSSFIIYVCILLCLFVSSGKLISSNEKIISSKCTLNWILI